MRCVVQVVVAVDVAARTLRGEENRDPLVDLRAEMVLRRLPLRVVAGIDLKRKARGLDRVVGVCVGPRAALELHARSLAGELLACGDKVQELLTASALFHLADAVRQPLHGEQPIAVPPEAIHLDSDLRRRLKRHRIPTRYHQGRQNCNRHMFYDGHHSLHFLLQTSKF